MNAPTTTHLELLRQLPAKAHIELKKCCPGGQYSLPGSGIGFFFPAHAPKYEALAWLPADPTAIILVADSFCGGEDETTLTVVTRGNRPTLFALEGLRGGSIVAPDPHEAALRLLLRVLR